MSLACLRRRTSLSSTGYFEIRAQLPANQGAWPDFWLVGTSPNNTDYTEIDVFETIDNERTQLHFSTHYGTRGPGSTVTVQLPFDYSQGMHTYGVNWSSTDLSLYVDGTKMASLDASPLVGGPAMTMMTCNGVGGSWPGSPDSTSVFPQNMEIAYMRAYAAGTDPTTVPITTSSTTPTPPSTTTPATTTTPSTTPQPVTVGSGSDSLVVTVNEDAYQGDAQFTVSVDGVQVGGTQTMTAISASDQTQAFTFNGNWGTGQHTVAVNFLNDAYGGSHDNDRNLYVTDMGYDGTDYPSDTAALDVSGPVSFTVGSAASTTPPSTTTPGPPHALNDAAAGHRRLRQRLARRHRQRGRVPGDAQFTVSVDGVQVGGTQTTTAIKGSGQTQAFTFNGNWGAGQHTVAVNFLNDAYGGTPRRPQSVC